MNYQLLTVENTLSGRDRAILQSLAMHRYLPAQYIERLHFYDHASPASASRSCRRVMERLLQRKLIQRLPERRIGGVYAGSTAYIYSLSRHGQKFVQRARGVSVSSNSFASTLFLDHTLEVAHTHVRLEEATRRNALELLAVQTEPLTWRPYVNTYGLQDTLKPDLYIATAPKHDDLYEDVWFIEVDRATESTAAIERKCLQYIDYRMSGHNEPGAFPLVVWLVPHSQRYHQLEALVSKLPSMHQNMFRVLHQNSFVNFVRTRYFLEHLPYAAV
jgi:hypothetical protein